MPLCFSTQAVHNFPKFLRFDFTSYEVDSSPYVDLAFQHEEAIQPDQIGCYKTMLHRQWIEDWLRSTDQTITTDELWAIREKCIRALEQ